jgi:hypothetical protein
LILCVYAIRKKDLKLKRKTLFDLRFFYLSQGEEKEEKGGNQERKNREGSNSPGESIARERERVLFL